MIRGLGTAAAPFVLPEAMAAAPIATPLAMGLGIGAGKAGRTIARAGGAGPGIQDLAEDVSGMACQYSLGVPASMAHLEYQRIFAESLE